MGAGDAVEGEEHCDVARLLGAWVLGEGVCRGGGGGDDGVGVGEGVLETSCADVRRRGRRGCRRGGGFVDRQQGTGDLEAIEEVHAEKQKAKVQTDSSNTTRLDSSNGLSISNRSSQKRWAGTKTGRDKGHKIAQCRLKSYSPRQR